VGPSISAYGGKKSSVAQCPGGIFLPELDQTDGAEDVQVFRASGRIFRGGGAKVFILGLGGVAAGLQTPTTTGGVLKE